MTVTFIRTQKEGKGCYYFFMTFASIIFLTAMIVLFRTLEVDDLKDYFFELLFILIMLIGTLAQFFRKKAKNIQTNLFIRNDKLYVDEVNSVPLSDLRLDLIEDKDAKLTRYHLWDINQTLSIYSYKEDELSTYLANGIVESSTFTETYYDYNQTSMSFLLKADSNYELVLNVDTGSYSRMLNEEIVQVTPAFYIENPAFIIKKSKD